jgi:serine/threonine protein kinase
MATQDDHFMDRKTCPTKTQLVAFNAGDLSTEELGWIGDHLAQCDRCASEIDTLDVTQDSVRCIRDALKEPLQSAPSAVYRNMERNIKRLMTEPKQTGLGHPDGEPISPFQLGQYQLLQRIGEGGMGTVYRGLHCRLKKRVAIKILNANLTTRHSSVVRFQREMEAVGRLDHENIVRATDAGESTGIHYLVMEFIDGIDLARAVSFSQRLSIPDACEIIRQVCVGLQHVHDNNLVHRDLKPSNLILTSEGTVKILDLGLAAFATPGKEGPDLTGGDQVLGTADYMAPEQWLGSHTASIQSDIYSVGCTFYKLLTGSAPFDGPSFRSNEQKRLGHLEVLAPALQVARPDAPNSLSAIIERMMRKAPTERYGVPRDIVTAIQPFCTDTDLRHYYRRIQHAIVPAGAIDTATHTTDGIGHNALVTRAGRGPGARFAQRRSLLAAALISVSLVAAVTFLVNWRTTSGSAQPPVFTHNEWHNLLDRPPTTFFGWNPDGQSRWEYGGVKKKQLSADSYHLSLLSFGRIDSSSYKLNVGFEQADWTGNFGIFWGGKREGPAESQRLTFQMIWVKPDGSAKRKKFLLQRGAGKIEFGLKPEPKLTQIDMASTKIEETLGHGPYDAGDCQLEIVISPNGSTGISAVKVNVQRMPALAGDGVNSNFTPSDYSGEFGVILSNTHVSVKSASLIRFN